VQRGLVKLSDDALVQQLEAHYFSKTKRRSLKEGVLVEPDKDDIRDLALNNKALPTLHPLNALIALKKVCVFPRSVSTEAAGTNGVIDNAIERFNMNLSYNNRKTVYQNCNRELQYSGKLCQLANVLVESGVVVTNSEINDHNGDDGEGNSNDVGLRGYPWTVKVDDVEGEVENSGSDEEDNEDSDDSDCGYDTASCSGSSSEDDEDGEKVNDNLRNSDNDSDDNDNESISSDTKLSENRKSENGDMKKCLIFAEHLHTLDVVEALVLKELFPSLRYSRLDGNVSAMQRALIADNFNRGIPTGSGMQADSMPSQVLLLTTGACGLGLNLSR
jgi:SNF2 family DNA or RNA helicase